MDTQSIDRLLSEHFMTKKYFRGVYAADKIPKITSYPCSLVINLVRNRKGFKIKLFLGHISQQGITLGCIMDKEQNPSLLF